MTLKQIRLHPARCNDRAAALGGFQLGACGDLQFGDAVGAEVGHCMALQPRPQVRDRIEFGSVGRQEGELDRAFGGVDIVAHQAAAMSSQSIPYDKRAGDTVVLETGSTSSGVTPTILPDGVRVEAQVLWGSIGWATPAAFGVALADPSRRTILITGEGSHQLTANDIGAMGRFGANVIVFVLNNGGYLIERAMEENPDWTYNDVAAWNYAELPKALGCADWYTARVTTLGELDDAMKAARASKTGAYIEIIGGKMDMPPALAFAHGRLKAMYGDAP